MRLRGHCLPLTWHPTASTSRLSPCQAGAVRCPTAHPEPSTQPRSLQRAQTDGSHPRAASSPSLPAQPPAGPEGAHIPGFGQPVAVPWLKVSGKEPARLESSGVWAAGLGAWGTAGCRGVATALRVPVPVPGGHPAEPCPCPCKDMVRAGTAVAGAGSTGGCQEGCQRVGSRQPSPPPRQPLSSPHSSWLGWSQPSAGAAPWRHLSSPTSSSPLAPGRCSPVPAARSWEAAGKRRAWLLAAMQGSPQPRGSCSVSAGAPHGLCPVPGTSPMPQAAPLGWHSSRGTDRDPVPTSHLHPLPAGTGGWGCSPSAPQVPQGWAQPAPTQALLPGAAEPRWQPGAEDRGQQRTLGRVLSPWNCIPPPQGERDPNPGSSTPIQGA